MNSNHNQLHMKTNLLLLLMGFLAACQSDSKKSQHSSDALSDTAANKKIVAKRDTNKASQTKASPGEELIYQDESIATYSDSIRRGAGVISFDLAVNDRLMIYNENGYLFGEIVLNEDLTYFTINMPRKTIARKVVPAFDFAAFDFDAEPVNSNDDYLRIYVNRELRKVKKAGIKYTFRNWEEYAKWSKDSPKASED
jgi:hypothetical protein